MKLEKMLKRTAGTLALLTATGCASVTVRESDLSYANPESMSRIRQIASNCDANYSFTRPKNPVSAQDVRTIAENYDNKIRSWNGRLYFVSSSPDGKTEVDEVRFNSTESGSVNSYASALLELQSKIPKQRGKTILLESPEPSLFSQTAGNQVSNMALAGATSISDSPNVKLDIKRQDLESTKYRVSAEFGAQSTSASQNRENYVFAGQSAAAIGISSMAWPVGTAVSATLVGIEAIGSQIEADHPTRGTRTLEEKADESIVSKTSSIINTAAAAGANSIIVLPYLGSLGVIYTNDPVDIQASGNTLGFTTTQTSAGFWAPVILTAGKTFAATGVGMLVHQETRDHNGPCPPHKQGITGGRKSEGPGGNGGGISGGSSGGAGGK